jgi:hypothetical protein
MLLMVCLVVSCILSFRNTQEIIHPEKVHLSGHETHADKLPVREVEAVLLEHEPYFHKTLKSCLPAEKKTCKLYIPEKSTAQRVAVMALPGDFGVYFFRLLQLIVYQARTTQHQIDIDLIPTSHVPPYGYGDTQWVQPAEPAYWKLVIWSNPSFDLTAKLQFCSGWTKIIRLIPKPLVLGATNALDFFMKEGESVDHISLDDIKSSLRLQMRYHCRLSHVAAHTALMSINIDEGLLLESALDSLIQKLQIFLGLKPADIWGSLTDFNEKADNTLIAPESLKDLFNGMTLRSASFLTESQTTTTNKVSILEELDKVLVEELRISKNLTAWPCESFWKVGPHDDPLELSPAVSRIAKSMSPDCLANYTSCWVPRDLCEAKGDGTCGGKK